MPKPRKKRVSVTLADPVLAVLEKAAESSGSTMSNVVSEVLGRSLLRKSEPPPPPDSREDSDEMVNALMSGMAALREAAEASLAVGNRESAESDYLRAASMGVEIISMMDRTGSAGEARMLKILVETLSLLKTGTGYTALPAVPAKRI